MCQLWRDTSSTLCQIGKGGPLPLLNVSRFFASCFLALSYWTSTGVSLLGCELFPGLLPFSPSSFQCLSYMCVHPAPHGVWKNSLTFRSGCLWGWDWDDLKEDIFFTFSAPLIFFLNNKHIHLFKKNPGMISDL